jgi:hypothetical protein
VSLSSELEVLVQLHEAGSLTDTEFEAAKAKLLSPDAPATKASTASPPVQKSIRAKKNDDNPHPMRVVVSSMLIIVAAVGLVFATMVPYKDDTRGEYKGNCSAPIFEMFQKVKNPTYNPLYQPTENQGEQKDWTAVGTEEKYLTNLCIEPGKPRLFTSLAFLFFSLVALGNLWRVEITDAISKHQNKK